MRLFTGVLSNACMMYLHSQMVREMIATGVPKGTKKVSINKRYKNINELCQKKIIEFYYKKQYQNILHSRVSTPPKEATKQAVDSVWSRFADVNPKWAQFYWSINGIASPFYIPSDLWFSYICRKMNSLDRFGWPQLQDKNYLDKVFDGVSRPETVIRNIAGQFLDHDFHCISVDKAVSLCQTGEDLVIKPSISSKGGRGIEFLQGQNGKEEILGILSRRKADYVVQKVLHQHGKMAGLNPDSINTVRVQTLLWNGEVSVLSALVRIGVKGCRIDNPHTSDGVSCVLTPEGKMIDTAYDRQWKPHGILPNGRSPEGFEVPCYDRLIDAVKNLQYRIPHSRLTGWDMAVSETGEPVLIEANMDYPEIYFHQLGGGPLIKEAALFEEVMSFVFK